MIYLFVFINFLKINSVVTPPPVVIYVTSLKNGTVVLNANLIFSSGINASYVVNQILNYSAVNSNILGQILPGSVSASGKKKIIFFIIIFKFSIYINIIF